MIHNIHCIQKVYIQKIEKIRDAFIQKYQRLLSLEKKIENVYFM